MTDTQPFSGEIVVASRIVDYLSSGLYESPAACLKELINNSYDADATRVDVFVKPDADRIIIADDGNGMSKDDFIKNFSRISESHKREGSSFTDLGRPKIGKIGIGFIAANEICNVMEIFSTKADSTELLHVRIYFDVMRESPDERRRGDGSFAKGDFEGEVLETEAESHYTQIFLQQIRGEAQSILAGATQEAHTAGNLSLYGMSAHTVEEILANASLRSWAEFDSYSQNMLRVALNIPVCYFNEWVPSSLRDELTDFEATVAALGFSAWFDGTELRKPVVFTPGDRKAFVRRFQLSGEHVSAEGYFYVQHGAVRPEEIQGLLIRIRNAAVGDYDQGFMGFSPSEGPLFQSWISAEVWADDRLEDAMNIDRRTLRIAHPAYTELQRALHSELSKLLKVARAELYGEGSKSRKQLQATRMVQSITKIADDRVARIAPGAATVLKDSWSEIADQGGSNKRLLQKYSVADLYSVVVEVAGEILTPEQFQVFLQRLTERLSK